MWSRRPSSSDGIRFCYGAVSFPEKIAPCAWTLELPARWPFGSVQLLSKCCFCANVVLVGLFILSSFLWILCLLGLSVYLIISFAVIVILLHVPGSKKVRRK